MGLGGLRSRGDLLQIVLVEGAGAAPFHLLEVVTALHIAHEQQTLQRLNVCSRGNHVHSDGDARVVLVAELGED
ncbi:hypothetical protein D3C79_900620 [compost metagenome]